MSGEGRFIRGLLARLTEGDPLSYLGVALAVGLVVYAMWRLLRDEDPPATTIQWVRIISIVTAGAGGLVGLLGLVAEFSFAPAVGQHVALVGSILFFAGFLTALISLTGEARAKLRGRSSPGD